MKQVVSFVDGKVSTLFLERAEAGKIEVPLRRVRRQKFRKKLDHLRAVVAHNRVDSLDRSRIT